MVYCLLADGFEETEAIATVDVLHRAKLDVQLVSIDKDVVKSSRGIEVITDKYIEYISHDYEAIVIPGGMPGTTNLAKCQFVRDLILEANEKKKLIGAICAAPSILGMLGILEGKKATCYPGFEDKLNGAIYLDEKVVTDGNIITAKGAGVSLDFGFAIVESLLDKETAEQIKNSMQC